MTIQETRLQNGRKAIADFGGVGKVARKMGYQNASYLVQIFGPNPTRQPSEKTCRKIEETLGLPHGSFDQDRPAARSGSVPKAGLLDVGQLASMITQVNDILEEEGAELSNDRVATLVSMAYEDGSTDRLRTVIRMLL